MIEVPLVCRHCGAEGSISETALIEVEAWRDLRSLVMRGDGTMDFRTGSVETDSGGWTYEDDFDPTGVQCSECQQGARCLNDLVVSKYGTDDLDRPLDECGEPFGPMLVHPDQIALELETAA